MKLNYTPRRATCSNAHAELWFQARMIYNRNIYLFYNAGYHVLGSGSSCFNNSIRINMDLGQESKHGDKNIDVSETDWMDAFVFSQHVSPALHSTDVITIDESQWCRVYEYLLSCCKILTSSLIQIIIHYDDYDIPIFPHSFISFS